MNSNYEALFALTRLGIGHYSALTTQIADWQLVKDLAENQGLTAVVLDGIEKFPEYQRPPKVFLFEWIGETLQGYEYRYELYQRAIAEMAGFYNSCGVKMMMLNGFACGLNWPKPEHRPYGDMDIWQFGKQKEADELLKSKKGIKIDNSHHHHTVFYWRDIMVENHYDFINVYLHRSNGEMEKIFKDLGRDDGHYVELNGKKVYLPSPNLHTLLLLKHMMNDFTAFSVSLRQLLDWGFHIKKYTKEIDWEWITMVLEKYHMMDFFNTINAICVEELGFPSTIFPFVQFNPSLKEMVLADILDSAFTDNTAQKLYSRIIYKYKRWKGNCWKHKMCYDESMWSALWSGVLGHILKPASR